MSVRNILGHQNKVMHEIIGSPTLADAKAIRKTKYILIWILFADQKLLLGKGWSSNKSQIILLTDNLSTWVVLGPWLPIYQSSGFQRRPQNLKKKDPI